MTAFFNHLLALSFLSWLNALIALAIVGVGFGAAKRMNKDTELTIIIAFSTVSAGAFGWFITTFWPWGWEQSFDTLFLGGVLALLIGTRRRTVWLRPELMPKISYGVSVVTWCAFFATV